MNNDSTPTPAADLPPPPPPAPENTGNDNVESVEPAPRPQDAKTPAQKRAQAQTRKKNDFLGGMMENLDTLIYVELCVLYYMDCSLFRLLIRVINQMMFLTPKPNFIPPIPQHRPYIGAIFGPNIICILLHIFTARSEAGEAMRGYLHGGVIVDLIGQKGPTSKVHLVLLDLLVLALQCFMLTVHVEKERLTAVLATLANPATAAVTASTQPRGEAVSAQDMDAEERGVMRDGIANTGDLELQRMETQNRGPPTTHDGNEGSEERNEERERLLAEPPPQQEEEDDNENPLDMFYSGHAILADFHVVHTLRRQWEDYGNASGSALQTVGFSAEFARVAANRRLNAAGQRLQRQVDSLGS